MLIVGGPLVGLTAFARCFGPAFADWKRLRVAGDSYTRYPVKGRIVSFDVFVDKARNQAAVLRLVEEFDRFVESVTGPTSLFQLEAPSRGLKLLLFEKPEDLNLYGGTILLSDFENNGGYYSKDRLEIGLIWGPRPVDSLHPDLRHEAAHLLFDLKSGEAGLSPWLSEGLACWYERMGAPDAPRDPYREAAREALTRDGRVALEPLFDVGRKAFSSAENRRWYGLSAAVVDYLLRGASETLRRRFVDHVALELAGRGRGAAAVLRSLDLEATALEAEVAAWITRPL